MANEQNLQPNVFSSENQPANRGRKKKFITSLKADGYSVSEVNDCLKTMLSLTKVELKKLSDQQNITLLESIVANALIKANQKGDITILETILARTYGKPKETIEVFHHKPEIEAATTLYRSLIEQGLSKEESLQEVLRSAQNNGFELSPDDILNATNIG